MSDIQNTLAITPNVLNVIQGNPHLTFDPKQLNALVNGTLILSTGSAHGCITHLRYQRDDEDLQQITLKDGTTTKVYTSTDIKNLAGFRERLQEAANHGHRVTFCIDTTTKEMVMLNVYPCQCDCKG